MAFNTKPGALVGASPDPREIGPYLDMHMDFVNSKAEHNYDVRLQCAEEWLGTSSVRYWLKAIPGTDVNSLQPMVFSVGNQERVQLRALPTESDLVLFNDKGKFFRLCYASNGNCYAEAYGDNSSSQLYSVILADSNGYSHFNRSYNAVYNDYAELFPRGEETEVGDIVALDTSVDQEQYVKASQSNNCVTGVHSGEFAFLIGGENPPQDSTEDFLEYNLKNYIPVGLVGRCKVKVKGKVRKGQDIIISDEPGVGRAFNEEKDDQKLLRHSVGFAVESSDEEGIKLVKVKLSGR